MIVLETSLSRYTMRIFEAGVQAGRAIEADNRRAWWRSSNEEGRRRVLNAHRQEEEAFDALYREVCRLVAEARRELVAEARRDPQDPEGGTAAVNHGGKP